MPPPPITIAFGSCHRLSAANGAANRLAEESILRKIVELSPSAFLWLGDAIYKEGLGSGTNSGTFDAPFNAMSSFKPYADLLSEVDGRIYGTWDDHDYGRNDAGRKLNNRTESLNAYLDFMNEPKDSIRRKRKGLYSSYVLDPNVKIIFLDTRYHRDDHYVPSVGGIKKLPLSPLIAAFSRLMVKLLGQGSNYEGEVLGEEQWEWLEDELEESKKAGPERVNVIVSSIQVLTTNPLVESWGHFPKEKRRLLELIGGKSENRVLLLSGDVHHAEFSKVGDILEVTSSGLTHSCSSPFYGFVCDIMLRSFPEHRHNNFYHVKENFGLLKFENGQVDVQIYGEDGSVVGETRLGGRAMDRSSIDWDENVPHLLDGRCSKNFMCCFGALVLLLFLALKLVLVLVGRSKKKKRMKKKND
ncbi:hypothetical protein TrVE_jg5748 [Triparma verrucosa]|uniref:PhoD-like phosphatase metallophosphatase domain-containing protein n=1 Tax=Triparma verrucosa TaxID=1606542 RepID=A0A9W6ZA97_9STRA|nr:hypothetical protein TrVE_jg5748 [Triparma verrucosa]